MNGIPFCRNIEQTWKKPQNDRTREIEKLWELTLSSGVTMSS